MAAFWEAVNSIWEPLRNLFVRFDVSDFFDILIVTILLFEVILLVRHTRAQQLAVGIMLLVLSYGIAEAASFRTLSYVLQAVMQFGIVVLAVIFQPELRRAIEQVGGVNSAFTRIFRKQHMEDTVRAAWERAAVAICDAAENMAETRTGALVVLERGTNLSEIINTGTPLNCDVNVETLTTVFYEGTPLHDGAVVVRDGRLAAAGCFLPLSNNLEVSKDMGTRHRSALGMSENSDAIVVVVSEETGIISLAKTGVMIRRLDRQNLFNLLITELLPAEQEQEKTSFFKKIRNRVKKEAADGEKANKAKRSFLDDKRIVFIIALLIALVSWMIIGGFIMPREETDITNVPIRFNTNSINYKNWDLEIVDYSRSEVTVTVKGEGGTIYNLTSASINVYCDYSGVQEPGTYELALRGEAFTSEGYSIESISPATVTVQFEQVTTVAHTLVVDSNGVSAEEGYFKGEATPSTLQIEVRGPQSELSDIGGVVVVIPDEVERSTNYTYSDAVVQLTDLNGEIMETSPLIEISPAEVSVDIPIYPIKTLPVTFNLNGASSVFDTAWFKTQLELDIQNMRVAGEAYLLDTLSELMVATLDVSTLQPGMSYSFPITLEDGIKNLDNIQQISITVDDTELEEREIEVPIEQVSIYNTASGLAIEPVGGTNATITVTLVGVGEDIDRLLEDQIAIEVNGGSITLEDGAQQHIAARVYVPSMSRVYAYGDYEILCSITEASE